nr:MAG TPA: endoplasmic reticulum protein [Caudoviricetes sp.]
MIPQARLINHASNFLESEIENIEKLLKDETVDDASKDILNKLLKEYKHDLEVIEREAV